MSIYRVDQLHIGDRIQFRASPAGAKYPRYLWADVLAVFSDGVLRVKAGPKHTAKIELIHINQVNTRHPGVVR